MAIVGLSGIENGNSARKSSSPAATTIDQTSPGTMATRLKDRDVYVLRGRIAATELDLSDRYLKDSDAKIIAKHLRNNTNLKTLRCDRCMTEQCASLKVVVVVVDGMDADLAATISEQKELDA